MSLTGSNLIDVTFAIDAWGQAAGGVWPHLALKLDGATIGQATVNSGTPGRYTITAKVAAGNAHNLQLVYDNDGTAGGADRNLFVRAVSVNGTSIATTDPSVTYDRGAVDGKDVVKGQEGLYWGGALTMPLPASLFPPPPVAETITAIAAVTKPYSVVVNAWGASAGGVPPHFKLLVDGKPVGEAKVAATSQTAYKFTVDLDPAAAHKIQIQYDNDAAVNGQDRNLFVGSVVVNGHSVASTAAGVTYDRGALDGKDVIAGQQGLWWNGTLSIPVSKDMLADNPAATPPVTGTPIPTLPKNQHGANAGVGSDRPPLASDVSTISWGADRGLAPQHLFWESVPDYANAAHLKETRDIAAGHLADGVVPLIGLQLWEDTFVSSQNGGAFANLGGHQAWVSWVKAHPQYLGRDSDGNVLHADSGNPYGWGYVSPLMPLDAEDAPAGWTGGTAHYADWMADKLGRLSALTGTRGYELADFFDGNPHSGVMNSFNTRMIAEFSAKTGIKVAGGTLAQQAQDIVDNHPTQWLDYFVDGWAYGWKALDEAIVKNTGHAAWLTTQVSFTPAAMREFAGVDARVIAATMNAKDILFNVQTLERFEMQHKQAPASYEQAMLGIHAARAPDAHFGHMMSSSENDYWGAVNSLYTGVSGTARDELGWGRLEQTWLQSGWTMIADDQGGVRRAAEQWSRSYHDWGEVKQPWLDMLRDIVPTRPFGPALYYSANAEKAMNALEPAGNSIGNAYLGELLEPITKLHDAGVPFGYYVSDAALPAMTKAGAPSAWIIPQATYQGHALFSDAEIAALKAKAPVLIGDEALTYHHPLTFTDKDPDAQITGYGFYDQKDRLIVVASDRVDFNDTAARKAVATHVELQLADGHYTVQDLMHNGSQGFDVVNGVGGFDTTIARWDTGVYAITHDIAA
ncbi:carbohydrate-binding domain-containing protein [Azospirillum sp. B510]|uniref:carbohydrate-binding domain-containing protein n=1 Tax=Azospirillum sp. (strain B510) TaxID=137722 RepID=UPI0002E433CE|nr:carbohydrate-binding domain-containing protein [Azospirillum sp. B510]